MKCLHFQISYRVFEIVTIAFSVKLICWGGGLTEKAQFTVCNFFSKSIKLLKKLYLVYVHFQNPYMSFFGKTSVYTLNFPIGFFKVSQNFFVQK